MNPTSSRVRQSHDWLSGGAGRDTFIFDTSPRTAGRDVIADFNHAQDTIWLDHHAFTRIGHGALGRGFFHLGPSALDANDHVIYDRSTGVPVIRHQRQRRGRRHTAGGPHPQAVACGQRLRSGLTPEPLCASADGRLARRRAHSVENAKEVCRGFLPCGMAEPLA